MVTHPKLGASWEGFALEQVIGASGVGEEDTFFWGVHNQAELVRNDNYSLPVTTIISFQWLRVVVVVSCCFPVWA